MNDENQLYSYFPCKPFEGINKEEGFKRVEIPFTHPIFKNNGMTNDGNDVTVNN